MQITSYLYKQTYADCFATVQYWWLFTPPCPDYVILNQHKYPGLTRCCNSVNTSVHTYTYTLAHMQPNLVILLFITLELGQSWRKSIRCLIA